MGGGGLSMLDFIETYQTAVAVSGSLPVALLPDLNDSLTSFPEAGTCHPTLRGRRTAATCRRKTNRTPRITALQSFPPPRTGDC